MCFLLLCPRNGTLWRRWTNPPFGHREFVVPLCAGHTAAGSPKCPYFAGAQSTVTLHCSTRNKQLQRQNNTTSAGTSLPEVFFSFVLLTLLIYPKNVQYLSPPTQGFSSKPFTSPPPSSKEAFFSPCRFFNLKDVCVTKKKK